MKQQSGFTLVEIAIVLVIIGLLLGGVLKGQEIITNAKIKNLENDFNGLSAAIYSYQDRYRALPGDDKNAATRFGNGTSGNGNGSIGGNFNADCSGGSGESCQFWIHLRNAGLVNGAVSDATQPLNAFNGLTGSSTGIGDSSVIKGLFIGFTNIPDDIAVILESRADDVENDAGTIRSSTAYGTATALHELHFAM